MLDNKEHIFAAGARHSSRNEGISFPKLVPKGHTSMHTQNMEEIMHTGTGTQTQKLSSNYTLVLVLVEYMQTRNCNPFYKVFDSNNYMYMYIYMHIKINQNVG